MILKVVLVSTDPDEQYILRLQGVEEGSCAIEYISRTQAVGFHYETYGDISPSGTLFKTLHCSVRFCCFKKIFVQENTYSSLGKAGWAHLITCHHIKSELLWLVLG